MSRRLYFVLGVGTGLLLALVGMRRALERLAAYEAEARELERFHDNFDRQMEEDRVNLAVRRAENNLRGIDDAASES